MSANIDYINYVRIQWLWLLCQHVMIMVIMSAYNNYWYYVCTQWLYKLCLLTMITDIMSAHNDYIYYVRIQWLWTFCLHVNCQFYKNINICILYYLLVFSTTSWRVFLKGWKIDFYRHTWILCHCT